MSTTAANGGNGGGVAERLAYAIMGIVVAAGASAAVAVAALRSQADLEDRISRQSEARYQALASELRAMRTAREEITVILNRYTRDSQDTVDRLRGVSAQLDRIEKLSDPALRR